MGAGRLPRDWKTPLTVTTYLQDVMESGGNPDSTIKTYRGILNRLGYWLHVTYELDLLDAQEEHLHAWRSGLNAQALQRRSIILYVTTVRNFYRWAHRHRYIEIDPAWTIRSPKTPPSVPRPISDEDLMMAIESAPLLIKVWLILAAYSGLRACEIAILRREDIYAAGRYMVVSGKGGRTRTVPYSTYVWDALLEYGLPGRGVIFRRKDGRPYRRGTITNISNDYLHGLGISDTLHACRHWFGTAGQEAIGDLRVLQDVMGHASPATTAGYAKPSDLKAREMVDAIQPSRRLQSSSDGDAA